MRDETLLSLLDVIDGMRRVLDELTSGYQECAQKIYSAELALLEEQEQPVVTKLCANYFQTKRRVMSGALGTGVESEKWNESNARAQTALKNIETGIAELRKKLLRSQA
jgi:hypothetical protein